MSENEHNHFCVECDTEYECNGLTWECCEGKWLRICSECSEKLHTEAQVSK